MKPDYSLSIEFIDTDKATEFKKQILMPIPSNKFIVVLVDTKNMKMIFGNRNYCQNLVPTNCLMVLGGGMVAKNENVLILYGHSIKYRKIEGFILNQFIELLKKEFDCEEVDCREE